MRIALFDYKVIPSNPIGGRHLQMLNDLCFEHDFTVFAAEFENPHPGRIRWVQIPTPTRPLALMFLAFHILAPYCYWLHCRASSASFDFVQMGECNIAFGHLAYPQFCHRFYLRQHWQNAHAGGMRGFLRWLDHRLHALAERWILGRVRDIVVPSQGLSRELQTEYPHIGTKIHVLPHSIDMESMQRPENFDRDGMRRQLGITRSDLGLVFIALGHFERKGLPMLLDALVEIDEPGIKLVVVGGESDLVSEYRERARKMGIEDCVRFVGMQRHTAPYLWASDALVLPSFYETFSLVALEAAAAGLPLIVTPFSGVADSLEDGENGILINPTTHGVAHGIRRFLELSPEARLQLGKNAQKTVKCYSVEEFVLRWQQLYRKASPVGC